MPIMDRSSARTSRQLFAERLAEDAGTAAKGYFLEPAGIAVEFKDAFDAVSEADRSIEQLIRDRIQAEYPNDDIVGEEGGGTEGDAFWSVDPIDGTSNFLAGIPLWGVSVGYCENGTPTVGAIHIPMLDMLLSANSDVAGIRHNGEFRAPPAPPKIATVALGQSPYWETRSYRLAEDIFRRAELECLNYRCSVVGTTFAAMGWTHGYYEERSNIWDVAAGYVIAQQAGLRSTITRFGADPKLTISVLTPGVHDRIGAELARRSGNEDMQVMANE